MAVNYATSPVVRNGLIYYIDGYNHRTIATGSTAVNDLQNTYDGTMTGNMFFADNCWDFTNGYIDNGTLNIPAFTDITIDMWIQVANYTQNNTFIDWGYGGGNSNGILFYTHSGGPGKFRGLIYNQAGTVYYGGIETLYSTIYPKPRRCQNVLGRDRTPTHGRKYILECWQERKQER